MWLRQLQKRSCKNVPEVTKGRRQRGWTVFFPAVLLTFGLLNRGLGQEDFAVALPNGVRAVWDFSNAYREATPTREKVCINGLWRWQPAEAPADPVPAKNWG